MAPLRNRAHRAQNDQDQMIEGLPIRNWRRLQGNIGAPVEEQPIVQYSRWPELPMPRDSHLLSDMSRQLLRLARLSRASKPADADEERNKENGNEDEVKKAIEPKGFQIRKWSQMAKDWNPPDREYVAKRRKGLPSQEGYNSLFGPDGQQRAFRSLKVKRIDGDGISHVYLCLAPVGVAVEGELPETDGGLSGPLEPRQPPGTIIDGIGIANEDGIIVAQPTPARRRGPPPPRKKKRFFGRNKKRIETEYGPDGLPVHPPGPSDLITRPDGEQGDDTQMQDANDNENDEEDEEGSGEEGEDGEDEDHDDHEDGEQDDHDHEHDEDGHDEHDEDHPVDGMERQISSSATPAPLISGLTSTTESANVSDVGEAMSAIAPALVPSSLRAEVQLESGEAVSPVALDTTAAPAVTDIVMGEAPAAVPVAAPLVPAVLDVPPALPATLEPVPIVEPILPELPPEIPSEIIDPPVEEIAPGETSTSTVMTLDTPVPSATLEPGEPIPLMDTTTASEPKVPQEPVIKPVDEQPMQSSAAIEVPDPAGTLPDSEAIVLPAISEVIPATLAVEPTQASTIATDGTPQPTEQEPAATEPPSAPVLEPVEPATVPSEPAPAPPPVAAPAESSVVKAPVEAVVEVVTAIEQPTQEPGAPMVEQVSTEEAIVQEQSDSNVTAGEADIQAEVPSASDVAAAEVTTIEPPAASVGQTATNEAATPVAAAPVEEPKEAQK